MKTRKQRTFNTAENTAFAANQNRFWSATSNGGTMNTVPNTYKTSAENEAFAANKNRFWSGNNGMTGPASTPVGANSNRLRNEANERARMSNENWYAAERAKERERLRKKKAAANTAAATGTKKNSLLTRMRKGIFGETKQNRINRFSGTGVAKRMLNIGQNKSV
jgi:hypothetical protein